jgi:hypothetical protein
MIFPVFASKPKKAMSQHAIEDLTEDTVHLIDTSDLTDKRDYLAAIYRIQGYYDTGYTHFRVMDILLKHGFVYRIAADIYPKYAARTAEVPGWMEDAETGELAYVQQEEGKNFLYVDAGSVSWELLCQQQLLPEAACKPLKPVPLPALIYQLLLLAEQQGNTTLINNWYGLMVNGCMDATFDEKDGFPSGIHQLVENEALLSIRQLVQRNGVKRLRNADEALMLPSLPSEVQMAGGLEKEYVARFYLDLKKTPEALLAAYEKAAKAKAAGVSLVDGLINGQLHAGLASRGWVNIPAPEPNRWSWYKDEPNGRRFIKVILEEADKFLMCYLGLQHNLLLDWQQRAADTEMAYVHFSQMAIASLPEDRQEDKKVLHPYGGWKFDLTKSKKILEAQIARLLEDLQIAEEQYFNYLHKEFPKAFFQRQPDRLLHLLEDGEDDTGIIPNYVLFDSPYAILLAFAYHYRTQGKDDKAAAMIGLVKEKLDSKPRKSAYETKYLEPYLAGDGAGMPPVYHHMLVQKLMADAQ